MKLFNMYCEDDSGEYELWFNEKKKLLGGYFCNDASWRGEYLNPIFEEVGVIVEVMKYNKSLATKSAKSLWG